MPCDVLSEVLTTLELGSRVYFRAELRSPWAIAVPAQEGVIRFHAVAEGACRLEVEGAAPRHLRAGDLAVVPHGAAHVLADAPGRPARALEEVLEGFDGAGPLVHGGDGPRAVLVCGHFRFETQPPHPLLASLPPLLHVGAGATTDYRWMDGLLRHMECEARARRTGHVEVTRRLSEVLLIEALRAQADHGGPAALCALADPGLARALEAIHGAPETDWSLEALARRAGLSRTLFAERFRERMGVPPMRYLATWRMHKARQLLRHPGRSVGEVARRVGYASESAFHRGFRAQFGASPGVWRRRAQGA